MSITELFRAKTVICALVHGVQLYLMEQAGLMLKLRPLGWEVFKIQGGRLA